jgi:hypothetical protein
LLMMPIQTDMKRRANFDRRLRRSLLSFWRVSELSGYKGILKTAVSSKRRGASYSFWRLMGGRWWALTCQIFWRHIQKNIQNSFLISFFVSSARDGC